MKGQITCQSSLEWIARLPFLAVEELALLLGEPRPELEALLYELRQRGWLDVIRPSSAEPSADPRYVLSASADGWLTARLRDRSTAQFPLGRTELIGRVTRIETTVALNQFVVGIVIATRKVPAVGLTGTSALPMKRPRDAHWPPGVQALGQLRVAGGIVSFLIVVDRPDAPAAHRRAMVGGWYRYQAISRTSPPLVIVCDGARRMQEWRRLITDIAARRAVARLNAVVVDGRTCGPSLHWQSQDCAVPTSLILHLSRHARPCPVSPAPGSWFVDAPDRLEPSSPLAVSLRRAPSVPDGRVRQEDRLAALALATAPAQWQLLECVGRLPLLSGPELAIVLGVPPRVARQLVRRCCEQGVIEAMERPDKVPSSTQRFVLAELGLRLHAARAGVPLGRFAKHTPFAAALPGKAGGRLATLVRQFEHTVGVNSFLIACLTCGITDGLQLVSWQNACEAAIRFDAGGTRRWLRPDGAGVIHYCGARFPFFLEWDRGTERLAVLIEKLRGYAAYYRSFDDARRTAPRPLFVVPDSQREDVVWRALGVIPQEWQGRMPDSLLTTVTPLVTKPGPFSAIWRGCVTEHDGPWSRNVAFGDAP